MKIRITENDSTDTPSIAFEGTLDEWLVVLRENAGAEEQTGSTEVEIIRELEREGKFVFAGCVGCYYTVEVVGTAAAAA